LLPLRGDLGGGGIAMAADVAETTQISNGLPAGGKRFPYSSPDCWMRTRSLFAELASWLDDVKTRRRRHQ
jgi:hypothetical protein